SAAAPLPRCSSARRKPPCWIPSASSSPSTASSISHSPLSLCTAIRCRGWGSPIPPCWRACSNWWPAPRWPGCWWARSASSPCALPIPRPGSRQIACSCPCTPRRSVCFRAGRPRASGWKACRPNTRRNCMREWTVGPEAEGKRLDRYLAARLGGVPAGALQKNLRLGRVKRNTRRASASDRLCAGDTLQLYLSDDCFEAAPPRRPDLLLAKFRPHLTVLYEDENLLLIDKRP